MVHTFIIFDRLSLALLFGRISLDVRRIGLFGEPYGMAVDNRNLRANCAVRTPKQ